MFPPVPAPFAGSTPPPLADDHRLSQLLDRSFAAIVILTGAGAGIAAWVLGVTPWQTSLGFGCLAMLPMAAIGIWTIGRAGAVSSLSVARLYSRVMQHLQASAGSQAATGACESPIDSFAMLVSRTAGNLKRSVTAHARTRQTAFLASQALQAGRGQASRLEAHLRGDGAAMADAASAMMAASAKLAGDAAQTSDGAAATDNAVARMVDQAVGLAGSVRHVTTQITRMMEIAVSSAEAAMGAQVHLAGLDTSARALEAKADQARHALQVPGDRGREAEPQTASGPPVAAGVAANLQEMARSGDAALTAMLTVVTGLRAETASASRRVAELSALIESQHELGDALSHAVGQQGEAVAQLVGLVREAHSGLAAVRAGVDSIGARNNVQLANAEALRGSIHRLPAYADTIAGILRGIPDFAPPREY